MAKIFPRAIPVFLLSLIMTSAAYAYRPATIVIDVTATGNEPITFSGWCDIEIGNRDIDRIQIFGQSDNFEPISIHGHHVDSCEITNETESGSITLILHVNGREIYRNATAESQTVLHYGPTMDRYTPNRR